ncbi:hypothetical protein EDB19DRAFT_1685121, partial [Suillus lakei]
MPKQVGDALLALSAMHGLGSSTRRLSYATALIRCMGLTRPSRVRHAALRAVSDAREEIASITNGSMPQGMDATLLDELSCVVLAVARPNHDPVVHGNSHPYATFHFDRDCCYARLIFSLAMNEEWHERLTRDGHLEWCISLVDTAQRAHWRWDFGCHLAGIFARIGPSDKVLFSSSAQE